MESLRPTGQAVDEVGSPPESAVPVYPQLGTLPDGRGALALPRRGQVRGVEAGTEATFVRPLAVRAMEEIGIDISAQESKKLQRYLGNLSST